MTGANSNEYVHRALGDEVKAIGGHYVLTKELRLPLGEREILCLLGHGLVDSSCCGVGGVCFAVVPGFVSRWKYKRDGDGLAVTEVEPIRQEDLRRNASRLVRSKSNVHQVNFW